MIHVVYGTRAELIKLSSLIREMKRRRIDFEIVDLGQHDTEGIRRSLDLPKPHHYFGKSYRAYWSRLESRLSTYPAAVFLALVWGMKGFIKLSSILSSSDLVIVHGNTMGAPLTIFAAKNRLKNPIRGRPKIVHVEAGVRANTKSSLLLDWFYKFADSNSDFLVTTSKTAHRNLTSIGRKPIYVGNVLKEVVSDAMSRKPKYKIRESDYVLVNSSRSIITKKHAEELVGAILKSPMKFYFIANPVIKNRLINSGLIDVIRKSDNIELLSPLDYIDMIHAIKNSKCVITDSAGVEEECAIMKKPCIVTNDFIQMPELVKYGIAKVTGCDAKKITHELNLIKSRKGLYLSSKKSKLEIGDGNATKRITDFLEGIERGL